MDMAHTHSYESGERLVFELERVLRGVDIKIAPNSLLEGMSYSVMRLVEQYQNPKLRPAGDKDIRPFHRECLGLMDIASKLVSVSGHPAFGALKPHLMLLNESSPLMNSKSGYLDSGNNKLFELFIACLCLGAGASDVELDNPDQSDGKNPDVIATFEGVRWGFACKALHTTSGMTMLQAIEKAILQIENSSAQRGVPVLNAKNIIVHDEMWGAKKGADGEYVFDAYSSADIPIGKLREFSEKLKKEIIIASGEDNWVDMYRGKKSIPAYLMYLPTSTATLRNGNILPTRLNMFNLCWNEPIDQPAMSVLTALNHSLQSMKDI
ncbi:hypothetical protein [Dyella sp. RRB7]|uniref:hypothetical protein n=1 Tax=Dyella sp. RRB7 TaxID=2919502 RepID=UPI001FA99799|nr:hypothetical protein [Dyella sp. RRB7]